MGQVLAHNMTPEGSTPGQGTWIVLEEHMHGVLELEHPVGIVHTAIGGRDVVGRPQGLPHIAGEVVAASSGKVFYVGIRAGHLHLLANRCGSRSSRSWLRHTAHAQARPQGYDQLDSAFCRA